MPKSVDYSRIFNIKNSDYLESNININKINNSKITNISKLSTNNIYLFENNSKYRSNCRTLDSTNNMSMSSSHSHSNYNYVP